MMAACSSSSAHPAAQHNARSGSTVTIGAVLDETGTYGALGGPEAVALKAFATSHSIIDGHPIKVDILNDQSNAIQAAADARTLLTNPSVDAIIGPSVGETMSAAYPIVAYKNKAETFMTPNAYPHYNQVPNIFGPNLAPTTDFWAGVQAAFPGAKPSQWITVVNNDASGVQDAAALKTAGVTSETVPTSVVDYSTVMQALRSRGYQGIIMFAQVPNSAAARKAELQIGWKAPMVLGANVFNSTFISLAGSAANGVYGFVSPATLSPTADSNPKLAKAVASFQRAFLSAGGQAGTEEPASWAWDAALSYVKAWQTDGWVLTGSKFLHALATQTVVGSAGVIHRTPTNHVGTASEGLLATLANGKIVVVRSHPAG